MKKNTFIKVVALVLSSGLMCSSYGENSAEAHVAEQDIANENNESAEAVVEDGSEKTEKKQEPISQKKTPDALEAILTQMENTTISEKEKPGLGSGKSDNASAGLNARFDHGRAPIFKNLSLDAEALIAAIKKNNLPFLEDDSRKALNEYLTLFLNIFKYSTHHQRVKINDTWKKINAYEKKYAQVVPATIEKTLNLLNADKTVVSNFTQMVHQHTMTIKQLLEKIQKNVESVKSLLDKIIEKEKSADNISDDLVSLATKSTDQHNNIVELQQSLLNKKLNQEKNKDTLRKNSQKRVAIKKSVQDTAKDLTAILGSLKKISEKVEAVLYMAEKQQKLANTPKYSHISPEGREVADNVTAALKKYKTLVDTMLSSFQLIFEASAIKENKELSKE
ncbi:MAG: hypothetical protein LBB12_00740 [Holosporaceae bacterium]|jgi:antitoxin component HigA of HigAB toxin-antitoxin module|nr:hypothetical protein [Holosporaceae bacterium]